MKGDSVIGAVLASLRHLVITAAVPGAVLVSSLFLVLASDSLNDDANVDSLIDEFNALEFGHISGLFMAATVIGLVLRPLQFSIIQALEGYWGAGRFGTWLASRFTETAVARGQRLARLSREYSEDQEWRKAVDDTIAAWDPYECKKLMDDRPMDSNRSVRIRLGLQRLEAARLRHKQPLLESRVMPTRLGNTLRRGEDMAGAPYMLDVVPLTGHFYAVSRPELVTHADGTRTQLDVSATLCAVFLVATAIFGVAFVNDGWWLA